MKTTAIPRYSGWEVHRDRWSSTALSITHRLDQYNDADEMHLGHQCETGNLLRNAQQCLRRRAFAERLGREDVKSSDGTKSRRTMPGTVWPRGFTHYHGSEEHVQAMSNAGNSGC